MAAEVEGFGDAGGPAVARAARFLADAAQVAFRAKLVRQQHVAFEFATAMTEVETAVALARLATHRNDDLMKAQARLWASQVALSVPSRVLSAMCAAGGVAPDDLARLQREGDLDGAIGLQAGRLADMNYVAERLTGLKTAE
jgi:alkylation response protein AidB-like acyl-CoA dehydrogenase